MGMELIIKENKEDTQHKESKEIPMKREVRLFSIREIIHQTNPRYHPNTGYVASSNMHTIQIVNTLSTHHIISKRKHHNPYHHMPSVINPKQFLNMLILTNKEKQ